MSDSQRPPAKPPELKKSTRLEPANESDLFPEADLELRQLTGFSVVEPSLHQITFRRTRLIDIRASGVSFEGAAFVDTEFERVDFANTTFPMARFERCVIRNSRLTGARFNESRLIDTRFVDCRIDLGGFRFASATRLSFDHCDLSQVDCREAEFENTTFESCNLTSADFAGASLSGSDWRRSNLEGVVIEPAQLRGITVSSDQALFLCGLLGLDINDG